MPDDVNGAVFRFRDASQGLLNAGGAVPDRRRGQGLHLHDMNVQREALERPLERLAHADEIRQLAQAPETEKTRHQDHVMSAHG